MVRTANASMQGADAVILVADAGYEISPVEQNVIAYLKSAGVPGILALNKVDLYRREQIAETIAAYAALHSFAAVVPICAKNGKNVDELLDECTPFLSPSDWFFPEDAVTDQPERQVAAEIIREKLLRTLNKEVPHGVAVVIDRYVDEKSMVSIYATIYCEKPSHKGIIVGKGGEELKRVGSYARADLEKLLGVRVYLNLWVKVKENWRDSARGVTDFGYSDE